jgi:LPXTG-motif cell wall-anchored protein
VIDAGLFIFIIFVLFLLVSQMSKKPFLVALAGVFSLIAGIILAINYTGESEAWAFSLIGFGLVLFGFWYTAAAYELSLEGEGNR